MLMLAGGAGLAHAQAAEGCPDSSALTAQFAWSNGAWTAVGSDGGITVSGDTSLARWASTSSAISAVVITAGSVTINYAYDPASKQGAVAATDVESAAGAPLANLGFCTGSVTNPTSGSTISVGLSKTAACATVTGDSATVTGTITVIRHRPQDPNAPSVAIRIRTTRDTVFDSNGAIVGETTSVAGLTGLVLQPGTDTVTVPYSVTFAPGNGTSFSNKIEITIEEATSGLDRHKYYAAWAPFNVCENGTGGATPTPTPTPTPVPGTQSHSPEGSVKAATGSPTPNLPNTSYDAPSANPSAWFFAVVLVGSSAGLVAVTVGRQRRRNRR
jgi:hypothetical protein